MRPWPLIGVIICQLTPGPSSTTLRWPKIGFIQINMFSNQEIQDFKELWQKEFGETISQEFAIEQATALVSLMKNIYRPMTEEEFKKYQINN